MSSQGGSTGFAAHSLPTSLAPVRSPGAFCAETRRCGVLSRPTGAARNRIQVRRRAGPTRSVLDESAEPWRKSKAAKMSSGTEAEAVPTIDHLHQQLSTHPQDGDVGSAFWEWEGFGRVRYLYAEQNDTNRDKPAILFIPGFGISASDYLQNIPALARAGYRVYAMDKLGLGESVPASRDVAQRITLQVWRDQIILFIEQVLHGGPVFIAGNSLGGLLCASVSSVRKELVRGAILLSPAPFWVMVPPATPALLRSALRALVRSSWGRLTNVDVLRQTLALVYARPENIPARTVEDILRPTRNEHAQHVFETILTSPGLEHGFEESIDMAFGNGDIPLAIIYGRQDPWVAPMFGLRIKALVRSCAFYELTPCGHCPHAEVPEAVNRVIIDWLSAVMRGTSVPPLSTETALGPSMVGDVSIYSRDHTPLNLLEQFALAQNYAVVFLAAYISTFMES
jgi:pimeloyl-ACP methyl ester carboxylesterase